jgi:SAM-dependent methyltransferase
MGHPEESDSAGTVAEGVNWSAELEEFHEDLSRDHPLEVLTREIMLDRLGTLESHPTVVDLGCSTGYLLEDLNRHIPSGRLVGFDLVTSGLKKAQSLVPSATVAQADACDIPLPDASVDALLSANLLEHIPNDHAAVSEIFRVLRPGSVAVIVVPAGPGVYDYYDRFLHHERRYGRGELARRGASVGFKIEEDTYIGTTVFPAFWATKKLNRKRYGALEGRELEAKVFGDYSGTDDSTVFKLACRADEWMLRHRVQMPFGIRGITVMRRPLNESS